MDTRHKNTCDVQDVYQNAVTLHQEGNLKQAIDLYSKILAQFTEVAEVHYNLGLALFELKKFRKAVTSYKRATELTPGTPIIFEIPGVPGRMETKSNPPKKTNSRA